MTASLVGQVGPGQRPASRRRRESSEGRLGPLLNQQPTPTTPPNPPPTLAVRGWPHWCPASESRLRVCGRILSAVLVQMKGWQRSFQPAMKARMAVVSSLTLSKEPRRMAWRVMIEKNTSTRLSQDPDVGVKCSVMRRFLASHALSRRVCACGSCRRRRAGGDAGRPGPRS